MGLQPPIPSELLCLWFWLWLKYNIAAQSYYCWWTHAYCIETIAPLAPFTYLSSQKKTLHCQLCSTRYAAVWINNCLKRTFAPIWKSWMEAITCLPQNRHFSWWTKMNGTQRRTLVSPWRMHCMYSSMEKDTSWWKNQARSFRHCWVTQVWRHQVGRQAGRQAGRAGQGRQSENFIKYFLKFCS